MMPLAIRRVFVTRPIVAPLIICFALITILSIHPSTRHSLGLLPSSWSNQYDAPAPFEDTPDLEPLPSAYEPFFPELRVPSVLDHGGTSLLAERLTQFLLRPIESHEEALSRNREHCPPSLSDLGVNPDQLRGDGDFWRTTVDKVMIVERRASLVEWLVEKLKQGVQIVGTDKLKGRGIVLTGGNQDTTLRMITLLRHLQRLNVKLPVEVFHFKGELTDHGHRKEITDLGAKIVEVSGVEKVSGVWKNWQIKGLAIIQSSFREVLYLDSDNIPLRDPSHLFDAPLYTDSGRAAFWPDLSKDHTDNAIWRLVGDRCTLAEWTFESGQIVIDKTGNDGLNLAALWVAAGMMNDRDFWFKMCGGDKDTFRWAFRMLDIPYAHSPRWMSALGFLNAYEQNRFCGHTTLQYDLVTPPGFSRPPPLFVHSNLLKHLSGGGLHKGNLFTHVKRMSIDDFAEPTLNYAHLWVYNGNARGMCLDVGMHDIASSGLTNEQRLAQFVETIPVEDLEGDVFAGFEDAFFDEGGRIGGW